MNLSSINPPHLGLSLLTSAVIVELCQLTAVPPGGLRKVQGPVPVIRQSPSPPVSASLLILVWSGSTTADQTPLGCCMATAEEDGVGLEIRALKRFNWDTGGQQRSASS